MADIIGTVNDDFLPGTGSFDLIEGLEGNDTLEGKSGRDTLYGGEGDDRIVTGAGPDVAYGGPGNDYILDDWTEGGSEVLHGDDGDDVIRTLNGGDVGPFPVETHWWLFGDAGNDRIVAGYGGTAHAYGGSGNDIIEMSAFGGGEAFGGTGDDRLYSHERSSINEVPDVGDQYGPGRGVTLDGGAGNDTLWGYAANQDTFVFAPGGGRDVVRNFGTGDWAIDRIDLSAFDFGMSAEDVFETYGHVQDARIVMNFAADAKLIVYGNGADLGPELTAQDVIDALIV
ncbi:calcium-binding protein [Salipiger mangrovisoli]|uniref:Peptidase M10 serralysin C-terminal domain-containing protein n=1 Tax=Salipiger mangrovisoli TaxID=2865933 RepID=A0ABR9X0K8_9RHOB|nr:hypothetical protein [Salipiger mangrovisoli]MBE9637082.1 hypothetical protein [Salipiger mangrovisoli]